MVSEFHSRIDENWIKIVPPISTIAALDAVVRLGTFAAAAKHLNRTPSAISHAVRDFEDKTGVSLFIRRGKRVILSDIGKAYIQELQVAIDALKRSNRTLNLHRNEPNIRVSAPPLFVATVLIPHLAEFEQRFEPYTLTVETTNQLVELESSDIDVAIRFAAETNPNLYYQSLPSLHSVPVCSATYAAQLDSGYRNATLIQSTQAPGAWARYLREIGQDAPSDEQIIEFDSTVSALEAARQNMGVVLGMFPLVCAYPGFGSELVAIKEAPVEHPQTYRLVCRTAAKGLDKVRVFSDWVNQTLGDMKETHTDPGR